MKTDRIVVIGLVVLGVIAGLWFLIVSPKRDQVSKLDDEITTLEASVAEQEQLAVFARDAETGYEGDYESLVVLGKAVPGDDDSASLIEQTQGLAELAGVDFRTIARAESEGTTSAPVAPTAPVAPAPESEAAPASESVPAGDTEASSAAPAGSEAPATTPTAGDSATATSAGAPTTLGAAPATETAAAALPIGATVGPAGLPVLPYDLSFRGDFFQIADFMAELDGMVRIGAEGIGVDGRLLTVDGFSLTGDAVEGFPALEATLHVNTYVAPADQGATAGATAAAPAAVTGAPVTAAPATASTPPATTPAP